MVWLKLKRPQLRYTMLLCSSRKQLHYNVINTDNYTHIPYKKLTSAWTGRSQQPTKWKFICFIFQNFFRAQASSFFLKFF